MNQQQLTLDLDPDLADQHRSLKECLAARIYSQRGGITAVAGKLDLSPSHLCEVLSGGGERNRKFDLDELERYIATYRDFTPIMYLISKFMPDEAANHKQVLAQLAELTAALPALLARAGVTKRGRA